MVILQITTLDEFHECVVQAMFHFPALHYHVDVTTELDEHETLTITAVSGTDAEDQAMELVAKGLVGLQGRKCTSMEVFDAE